MKINFKLLALVVLELSFFLILCFTFYDNVIEVGKTNLSLENNESIEGLHYIDDNEEQLIFAKEFGYKKDLEEIIMLQDGAYVYKLEFPCQNYDGGGKLFLSNNKLPDEIMNVLLSGFPYNTASSMGFSTDEEAYEATQLAIWEVAYNTKKYNSTERALIESQRLIKHGSIISAYVYDYAKEMVNKAQNTDTPKIEVEVEATNDISMQNIVCYNLEHTIIGPYKVNVNNFNYTSGKVKAYIGDKEVYIELLDKNKNTISSQNIINGEEFYIKTLEKRDLTLQFEFTGIIKTYKMYQNQQYNYVCPSIAETKITKIVHTNGSIE